MILIALPVVASLLKESPSQMGLFPDGASSPVGIDADDLVGMSSREACHTSTFWVLIGAVVLLGASVHACVLHLAAMLTDRGMTPQIAALASSIAGLGVLAGRLTTGILLDRYFGPRLAICFSICAALGAGLLLIARGGVVPFVGAFLVGLGMGAEGDLIAYLTSRYFGLKSFAELYGFTFGSFVLAGACGTFLMGLGFDRTDSYVVPQLGFLVAILIAIVLFSRLGPYQYTAFREHERVPHRQVAVAGQGRVAPAGR